METPGMILKREREAKGLTIRELAKVTRIPDASLIAIENNEFGNFSAEVFVRGFLRNYARELSLSADEVMQAYDAFKAEQGRGLSSELYPSHESSTVVLGSKEERQAANSNEEETVTPSFRLAYLAVALIAMASIGISLLFTGIGEADEGNGLYPELSNESVESPFLMSDGAEAWLEQ